MYYNWHVIEWRSRQRYVVVEIDDKHRRRDIPGRDFDVSKERSEGWVIT